MARITGPEARARATYLVYRGLGGAIQRAPDPVVDLVAAVVGEVMARRSRGPEVMRTQHLRRVLASSSPVVDPDPEVLRRWVRRSFRAYARYWVEGARLPAIPAADIDRRMIVERGYEHLKDGMASGRGVVMVLPHVGSWEWGGAFLAHEGFPMTSVAERIEPPELFDWFVEQRQAMGLTIVPLGQESGGTVLRTLREGGLVGLLCDRDIVGNGIPVDFFGETTTFPAGPATLALRTGAVLVAAAVYSGPGRHHTGVITAPFDTTRTGGLRKDVARITQDIARQFERFIRRSPEQWHLYQPNWPSDEPDDRPAGDAATTVRAAGATPAVGE
ncbi:MAG TPA: phosphatidylinositol mannoside acyltransferase [Acidimicrobiales bacterium]|jgi:KDO2-lipid IV(A) lauroyltransferase|nr:phosphatidylinositol mannoside acyltransferase [Acidimicrobiales bacterium]